MTIVTVSAGSVVGGAVAAESVIGLATGLGVATMGKVLGPGTVSAAVGCVAASASAGAIYGAAWGKTVTGALLSSATAAASSSTLALALNAFAGPVGWLVLGAANNDPVPETCSFDCWKPVLHDTSKEPSAGKLLRDVVTDAAIKNVTINDSGATLPEIILTNIWDEQFRIEYIMLPSKKMAAHAVALN